MLGEASSGELTTVVTQRLTSALPAANPQGQSPGHPYSKSSGTTMAALGCSSRQLAPAAVSKQVGGGDLLAALAHWLLAGVDVASHVSAVLFLPKCSWCNDGLHGRVARETIPPMAEKKSPVEPLRSSAIEGRRGSALHCHRIGVFLTASSGLNAVLFVRGQAFLARRPALQVLPGRTSRTKRHLPPIALPYSLLEQDGPAVSFVRFSAALPTKTMQRVVVSM
ncbi:hypothetical protein HPB50_023608 [Hyalomma asiaticum]|uniref:Uncharacterized protein n=1 Tax=Hyalomma asiaticum TaxID=266040 RepID=A0ACB7T689_HYAAI|nr:hypothetical protein HPB50_023608 [Hyalomma asiaticum]